MSSVKWPEFVTERLNRSVAGQQLPEGRYGSRVRKTPRRGLRWALFGFALVGALVVTVVGYNNLGSQPIEGKQVAFVVADDQSVRVTLEVRRDQPQRPVDCVVRARAESGDEVGRKEVLIPPSAADTVRNETVIKTSSRGVVGEVYGCTYSVPEYLSTKTRPSG